MYRASFADSDKQKSKENSRNFLEESSEFGKKAEMEIQNFLKWTPMSKPVSSLNTSIMNASGFEKAKQSPESSEGLGTLELLFKPFSKDNSGIGTPASMNKKATNNILTRHKQNAK